ncbi:DUF1236 domain-containing protein [Mesorhizobium microcysteis]|uniref:DUF1236 domain-containing protein n=1 Tax=Neoaquamicrobium microcysteis TaxID=2682781 RepID=A0A5D4GSQ1_9HYPH|nr:DUF1236 domain-containing protein [Mesorhizobium microcysteis]TYR31367.1 DUF1236 domain-containing protein [Mesorhizobium microcysteis]
MKTKFLVSAATCAMLALTGTAMAQTAVVATTDLNIRSGPGPEYPVIGAIAIDDQAMLGGCIEGSKWCQISYAGAEGWVYSDYLIADNAGVEVIVTERPAGMDVPVAVYEGPAETAPVDGGAVGGVTGGVTGAIAGAIIAGPVGAAVGGIAGAAGGGVTGSIIDPNPEVRTYVQENPVEPVYLEGEVVVGASLPETVEVREIPDYEYRYVYVNGQPVLVEPGTNRIVYIVR